MLYRGEIIKRALASSILICTLTVILSNAQGKNFKAWDSNNKLTWADFRDTTIAHSDRAALTNSGIKIDISQTSEKALTINAYSAMDRGKSWVDVTKKSDYILFHEQYHFNITEYWCRKLKKDYSEARFTGKNMKQKIESIRKEDFAQLHDMQDDYDRETNHSQIAEAQKIWEKKIDDLLKSLDQYSANTITVNLK